MPTLILARVKYTLHLNMKIRMWEFLKDNYLGTSLSGYKLLKTAVETEGETKSQCSFLSLFFPWRRCTTELH